MIAPETTALILLAAGKSARFGLSDKLTEMFLGQPLGMHVVTALDAVPFARRVAVRDGVQLDYAARGYHEVHNSHPEQGLSLSLKMGVAAARGPGIEAVLIALADMPWIRRETTGRCSCTTARGRWCRSHWSRPSPRRCIVTGRRSRSCPWPRR